MQPVVTPNVKISAAAAMAFLRMLILFI